MTARRDSLLFFSSHLSSPQKMMRTVTLCLVAGVFVLGFGSCSDLKNDNIPDQEKSSVVHCDSYYTCPTGTTCCRHPKGAWFCCPYSPGRCCLDGFHCCPYGYDCDFTYTHCVRETLTYPFSPKVALSSVPADRVSIPEDNSSLQKTTPVQQTTIAAVTEANMDMGETRVKSCDSRFYCPTWSTCCKGLSGRWNCCPYFLGKCCPDGKHCCQFGYTCDPSSLTCRRWW